MSRMQRAHALLPATVLIALLVVAAFAIPDSIAIGIRHVFARASLRNLLLAGVVGGGLVVLGRRLARGHRPPQGADALASLVRRTPWPVSVSVVAVACGVGWYALGRALTVPLIFADELIYASAARTIAEGRVPGGHGYGLITPLVDSVAFLVTSTDVGAYRLIQAINVGAAMTAAFPAYLLARRALSRPLAHLVAGLTVVTPWLVYTRFVMTEAVFYPVFLLFVLALVRALERTTLSRQLVLAVALCLAFAARTQAVVLAGAVVAAVVIQGLSRRRLRTALAAFRATWCLYALGALVGGALAAASVVEPLGAYSVLLHGWWHPRGLSLWAAANMTSFAAGLGVLVAGAFPLGAAAMLRRDATSGERSLASASVASVLALLATVVVLSQSAYGQGTVHERGLFFAVPLVLIGALAWATRDFPRPVLLTTGVVVALVGLALYMPVGPITGRSVDALSFKLWTQTGGTISPRQAIVLAAGVGALLLLCLRSTWPLVLTFVFAAAGVAAAGDYRTTDARELTSRYGWVDAAPGRGEATLVWVGDAGASCPSGTEASRLGKVALYTEFFNSRITRTGHLFGDNAARGIASADLAVQPDGTVTMGGTPLRPGFVVTDARVRVDGSRVALLRASDVGIEGAGGAALALWRVDPPVRLKGSVAEVRALGSACAA